MIYKSKTQTIRDDTPHRLEPRYTGSAITVQSVYYSSTDPSKKLHLLDGDGDEFMHPIPGQIEPKAVTLDPVTVKGPIHYVDESEGHMLVVFGEVHKNVL